MPLLALALTIYAPKRPTASPLKLSDATPSKALAARKQARSYVRANTGSLLTGRIFDDRGNRMTPSTANARGVRYRYYVSRVLAQGRKNDAGSVPRVPAPEIEARVAAAIREQVPDASPQSQQELIASHLQRVTVHKQKLELRLQADDIDEERRVTIPWAFTSPTRKREILIPYSASAARPIRAESRARLVAGIAKARLWLDQLVSGEIDSTSEIAERENCSERSVRMTLGLAFLSPAIVKAAVDGTLPRGCGVSQCLDMPCSWSAQWREIAGSPMKLTSTLVAVCLLSSTAAFAEDSASTLNSVPPNSATVTNYYKQNVYDPADHKIGDIKDVLVDDSGKVTALIVAAGGFLGMGEHDVAVPFSAVKGTQKDGKWYLTMNATKDALKAAPGLKYDRTKTTWVPENASTTGTGNNR